MSYRKVGDASLTTVADAIRAKGGTTSAMVFPDGFVDAVNAIYDYEADLKSIIEKNPTTPKLPAGLTYIGQYTFFGCSDLKLTELPPGITVIDDYAFFACESLALTELPAGVTSIGSLAFYSCALRITELPASLTSIDSNAFRNNITLTTLTFKSKTVTIASNAFEKCRNLTKINVPWSEGAVSGAPWGATNATINYDYV
jgi:hypothetical protein